MFPLGPQNGRGVKSDPIAQRSILLKNSLTFFT